MEPHPPADWFEFWVRFVFGALFGGGVGLTLAGSSHVWPVLLMSGVVFGVVAGWFGDRFWYSLRSWFW